MTISEDEIRQWAERQRREKRLAEVADLEQRAWVQFASAAISGLFADSVKTGASAAAETADFLVAEMKKRFGTPTENESK